MSTLNAWLSAAPRSRSQAYAQALIQACRVFGKNRLAVVGLSIVCLLLFIALFAPFLSPYDPNQPAVSERLLAPNAEHLFGTDELGRDIFSRVIYGSRVTLHVIFLVVVIVGSVGLLVGITAGYFGGLVDAIAMRISDVLLAFPGLILALAFVSVLGPGLENAIIAISLTAWPQLARLARAECLVIRNRDFIAAVRLQGGSHFRVILLHILPLCLSTVIVRITLYISGIILTTASLGFLGLGAQPPSPEWGAMLASGRQFMLLHWWLAAMPGLAILLTTIGFSLLGDGLRDVLDPQSRGS